MKKERERKKEKRPEQWGARVFNSALFDSAFQVEPTEVPL